MAAPTRKQRLETSGKSTEGLTPKEINEEFLKLPADGKLRKALAKYGFTAGNNVSIHASLRGRDGLSTTETSENNITSDIVQSRQNRFSD